MSALRYRRILLKISGEMLAGNQAYGIQPEVLKTLAIEIAEVVQMDVELALVIGGGNIFRGIAASSSGMERASADYMGMLATMLNALALQNTLEQMNISTPRTISARFFGRTRIRAPISRASVTSTTTFHATNSRTMRSPRRSSCVCSGRNRKSVFHYRYRRRPSGDGNRRGRHPERHKSGWHL